MKPKYIIIHHSATPDGKVFDTAAIRRFHTSWRHDGDIITQDEAYGLRDQGEKVTAPWRDIGYHFLIEDVDGSPEVIVGRMMNETGAHCRHASMNSQSLGICFIGNYDLGPVPENLMLVGVKLIRGLISTLSIPLSHVKMHRNFNMEKTCPGILFQWDFLVENLQKI